MSAPYHDLENKVEAALKTYLIANVTPAQLNGATVQTATTEVDFGTGTYVICTCKRAQGRKGLAGNALVTASVIVRSMGNPVPSRILADHRARAAYVRDALLDDALINTLDSADSLTVQGISDEWLFETRLDEDHWESELTLEMLCCPS